MGADRLRRKSVPWCSVCLVLGVVACHLCVLIGNYKVAQTIDDIGSSTTGWSHVGLGVSRAFREELIVEMQNVSQQIVGAIEQIQSQIMPQIDQVISLAGSASSGGAAASALLQQPTMSPPSGFDFVVTPSASAAAGLVPVVTNALHQVLEGVMNTLVNAINSFMEMIKPALVVVGQWIVQFGPKIQAVIDAFTTSLDNAQKTVDKIMAKLHGGKTNKEIMIDETFNLFDVSNTGLITTQDLLDVATLYGITALQGQKSGELMDIYDANADGQLDRNEFSNFVEDESIPNSMSVVLRRYAKKLAEVGGAVAASVMRDEISLSVVQYFQLVCSKNQTKVGWVSQALSNGSLPLDFTADVLAQMCLHRDDPNSMTTVDIGALVVGNMYAMNATRALEAVDRIANTTFWVGEGFNIDYQAGCVEMATGWTTQAAQNQTNTSGAMSLLDATDAEVLRSMPSIARSLAESNVRAFKLQRLRRRQAERESLFQTTASRNALHRLLGGVPAADAGASTAAEMAINSGKPAMPETLLFAQWLSQNASATAKIFQDECFDYSSKSSSQLDGFAAKIKNVFSKVSGFIDTLETYATPSGIANLEATVSQFAVNALNDTLQAVETKVGALVNQSMPALESQIENAAAAVGQEIGTALGNAVGAPLGQAVASPLGGTIGQALNNSAAGTMIGDSLAPLLGSAIGDLTGNTIGDLLGDLMRGLVEQGLGATSNAVNGLANSTGSLALMEARRQAQPASPSIGGMSLQQLVTTLSSIQNALPLAVGMLKKARLEVNGAAESMDGVFTTMSLKGETMLNKVSHLWRVLWVLYFLVFALMALVLLAYSFWSCGYFGGPRANDTSEYSQYQRPSTWAERLRVLWRSCCLCTSTYHDTGLCFWSLVIVMQVIVLVLFLLAVVLSIVGGIEVFISTGCRQLYVLSDMTVCSESLQNFRGFLPNFTVGVGNQNLEFGEDCNRESLLLCDHISQTLVTSAILTCVFSFLAALVSAQLILEAAMLHEHATFRRLAAQRDKRTQSDTP